MLKFQKTTKTIEIDGQDVHLQGASEGQLQKWHEQFHDSKGRPIRSKMVDNRIQLAILCVVNEDGSQMFDQTHATELREWPASVLATIHKEASILCGIADEEDFEKKSND